MAHARLDVDGGEGVVEEVHVGLGVDGPRQRHPRPLFLLLLLL